jgi:hypothetical protein
MINSYLESKNSFCSALMIHLLQRATRPWKLTPNHSLQKTAKKNNTVEITIWRHGAQSYKWMIPAID